MPRPTKAGQPPTESTSQPKFWPKKPVIQLSDRKIVAITASCFITPFTRFDAIDR